MSRKNFALILAASMLLVSCVQNDAISPSSASGTQPVSSLEAQPQLPAVTDQEIEQLINTVMQGVDVPRF